MLLFRSCKKQKNSALMSQANFFYLFILTLINLVAPNSAFSDELKDQPYKATTVDECVLEEACVWFAFKGIKFPTNEIDRTQDYLFKRQGNILIRVGGLKDNRYNSVFASAKQQLEKVFPYKYVFGQDWDTSYIFSEDIDNSINSVNREKIITLFGSSRLIDDYNSIKSHGDTSCIGFVYGTKDDGHVVGLHFFDWNDENLATCIESIMLADLGLGTVETLDGFPFSVVNRTESGPSEITKLDLLLVSILYDERMKFGASFGEVEAVFRNVYEDKVQGMEK